jgi:hypothetical protein
VKPLVHGPGFALIGSWVRVPQRPRLISTLRKVGRKGTAGTRTGREADPKGRPSGLCEEGTVRQLNQQFKPRPRCDWRHGVEVHKQFLDHRDERLPATRTAQGRRIFTILLGIHSGPPYGRDRTSGRLRGARVIPAIHWLPSGRGYVPDLRRHRRARDRRYWHRGSSFRKVGAAHGLREPGRTWDALDAAGGVGGPGEVGWTKV